MSTKQSRPKKQPTGDYESGYARPPEHTKFKPGHKGRGGRPKGSKRRSSIETAFEREVTVTEKGKTQKVSIEEAIALGALQKALGGDSKALGAVLKIMQMLEKRRPPPLSAEEREKAQTARTCISKVHRASQSCVWTSQAAWLVSIGQLPRRTRGTG